MTIRELNLHDLAFNPFDKIGKEWFLISAGNETNYNTMTASWGMLGVLWNKPVVQCFIRPQRYTYEFVEEQDVFTISFLNENYRSALNACGKTSGRDGDKFRGNDLTPLFVNNTTAVGEADLIFVCKKLYAYDMEPNQFIESELIAKNYPAHDFHRCFVAEILHVYTTED